MSDKISDPIRLPSDALIGNSPSISTVKDNIINYALLNEPILIQGETGVGKNFVSRLIHLLSGRCGQFVEIDTPNLQDGLFESRFLGHVKGAFTGADSDHAGYIDEASNGTVLFDEIGDINLAFQLKLLRFIDSNSYTRLGDPKCRSSNVRLISATSSNLIAGIKNNSFRRDLYYRLCVLKIYIPPLRERKDDLFLFINKYTKSMIKNKIVTPDYYSALLSHSWPGNVRELKSVIKRISLLNKEIVSAKDVFYHLEKLDISTTTSDDHNYAVADLWQNLMAGNCFWEVIKKPFLRHDIKRSEINEILCKGLNRTRGKYIDLLELFNLSKSDYKCFMRFINNYKLSGTIRR